MKNKMDKFFFQFLVIVSFMVGVSAKGFSAELEYPELQMTPRNSDRLASEAATGAGGFLNYLPIQIPSLITTTAGIVQVAGGLTSRDTYGVIPWIGVGVGGGWLVTSAFLELLYHPYENGAIENAKLPKGSTREQLTRERQAEEVIRSASKLSNRLEWLAFFSNFAASGVMLAYSNFPSVQMGFDIGAMLFSFTPLLFSSRWSLISDQQESYRKRIYGPVANLSPALFQVAVNNQTSIISGVRMELRF